MESRINSAEVLGKPTSKNIRVLIIDEHPVTREALAILVDREEDLKVCGEADNLATALQEIRRCCPNVVVLSLAFNRSQSLQLLEEIKQHFSAVHILAVSMRDDPLYAERVLRAGAGGFLQREEMVKQLIAAIRYVVSGEVFLSSQTTSRLLRRRVNGQGADESPVERLSERQLQVFELIGQGYTMRQIAGHLGLSHKTVEGHREMVKSKLGLKNSNQLSRLAISWLLGHG